VDVFEHIDKVLLQEEGWTARVARKASTRPSDASAVLFDQTEAKITGACHRAVYLRLVGTPVEEIIKPEKAMQFRVGRAVEEDLGGLARKAGIFVAAGVRVEIPHLNTSLEMDDILIDPETQQPIIADCKTISGYWSNDQVLNKGKVKWSAVMQLLVYLNEFRTGAALKEAIRQASSDKTVMEGRTIELRRLLEAKTGTEEEQKVMAHELHDLEWKRKWNRVQVDWDNFAAMGDGPSTGMLIYISRDEAGRRQFNIGISCDPLDGWHYPSVDGAVVPIFTVESIYERFQTLQGYYLRTYDEAVRRLELRGVRAPATDAHYYEVKKYWEALGLEMRSLPLEFMPPAEYEWNYSPEKIEALYERGFLGKTKYKEWKTVSSGKNRKSREVPVLGDWHCNFCNYRKRCIGLQDPAYANLASDLISIDDANAA